MFNKLHKNISNIYVGAVMLIGVKRSCNHCLKLCFFHQMFTKKFKLENKLKFCTLSNLISYSTND